MKIIRKSNAFFIIYLLLSVIIFLSKEAFLTKKSKNILENEKQVDIIEKTCLINAFYSEIKICHSSTIFAKNSKINFSSFSNIKIYNCFINNSRNSTIG